MNHIKIPIYQKISLNLVEKIASGYYPEGHRLSIRSDITKEYNVSAETARKAVQHLVEYEIMSSFHGSGTEVVSQKKAIQYLNQHKDQIVLNQIRQDIQATIENQKNDWKIMSDKVNQLFDYTREMTQVNPFTPYVLYLNKNAQHIGESCSSLKLWEKTKATLIAIERDNELSVSPGPDSHFMINDTLYFICSEVSFNTIKQLFYPN